MEKIIPDDPADMVVGFAAVKSQGNAVLNIEEKIIFDDRVSAAVPISTAGPASCPAGALMLRNRLWRTIQLAP